MQQQSEQVQCERELCQTQVPSTNWDRAPMKKQQNFRKEKTSQTMKSTVIRPTRHAKNVEHTTLVAQSSVNAVQNRRTLHSIKRETEHEPGGKSYLRKLRGPTSRSSCDQVQKAKEHITRNRAVIKGVADKANNHKQIAVDRYDSDQMYRASLDAEGQTGEDVLHLDSIIENSGKTNDPKHKPSKATITHLQSRDKVVSTHNTSHAKTVRDHQ